MTRILILSLVQIQVERNTFHFFSIGPSVSSRCRHTVFTAIDITHICVGCLMGRKAKPWLGEGKSQWKVLCGGRREHFLDSSSFFP